MKAGLVKKMEDWPHSSFIDYLDQRESICNTELARELLNLNASRFMRIPIKQ